MKLKKFLCLFVIAMMIFTVAGCGGSSDDDTSSSSGSSDSETETTTGEYSATTAEEHAIYFDTGSHSYNDITVTKIGDGDESKGSEYYDWYGNNAAILASGDAVITITGSSGITSNADFGSAVFAYKGRINISDAKITTTKRNSGGIMVTGGGTISADNLTITTAGQSSAAIRSDKGGGTITVNGGTYTTSGVGSPAIYSTADITVNNAALESTTAQGVCIEGKNDVTLNDCTMTVDNTTVKGTQTSYKQAIMIYQSMSGDSDEGTSKFTMNGGKITNNTGDIFFVTNTSAVINLNDVTITNNDSDGMFMRVEAAGWGTGGKVTFTATDMNFSGDINVDSESTLELILSGDTNFEGSITSHDNNVKVTIDSSANWIH